PPDICTLSLHDALPICFRAIVEVGIERRRDGGTVPRLAHLPAELGIGDGRAGDQATLVALPPQLLCQAYCRLRARADPDQIGRLDRKSTRLNSSHVSIS